MKGTLFSGDFIKDELGNLRLVEFNTDTASRTYDRGIRLQWTLSNT